MARGNVRLKKGRKGYYEVRISLGNGKRKSYTIQGTKREAEQLRTKKLAELDHGRLVTSQSTFRQHVDAWLEYGVNQKEWSPTTEARYRSVMDLHVLPVLGDEQVSRLKRQRIDRMFAQFLKDGVGLPTIDKARTALSSACSLAVGWELLAVNPVKDTELPESKAKSDYLPATADLQALGDELVNHNDGDQRMARLLQVFMGTGVRLGESLALRWDDVDFDKSAITVDEGVIPVTGKGMVAKNPKTEAGKRLVPIDAWTLGVFREMHAAAVRLAHDFDTELDPRAYVWSDEVDGSRPWRGNKVHQAFRRARRRLELPEALTPHAVRHWHISTLHDAGLPWAVIAERVGHTRIHTTDRYTHAFDRSEDVFAAMDKALMAQSTSAE